MKKARNSVDFRQRDWNQGSTRPTNMEDWEVTKPHNDSSNETTSNKPQTTDTSQQDASNDVRAGILFITLHCL